MPGVPSEPEDKCEPFMRVRLRPLDAPNQGDGVSAAGDLQGDGVSAAGDLQVTVYQGSSLPEFLVPRDVFDASRTVLPGTRIKMWFANRGSRGGSWWNGKVFTNRALEEGGDPWECLKVFANRALEEGGDPSECLKVFANRALEEDGDPWECLKVQWDKDDDFSEVCPWEVTVSTK
ncbi:hypothetical protein T484DRAFT_1845427 [Baffinella frigidus]|nr:hypothetical protein T484DRAFT_1845427 [Cryptophyta sp. CCMP2293]